jgi:hypothetical protein
MNKKLFLLCCILSLPFSMKAQFAAKEEFEGSVKYTITAISKTKNITTEELQSIFGDTLIFYIKKIITECHTMVWM